MFDTIFYEKEIANHPRTKALFLRFPSAEKVPIDRYGEVFCRKENHFREQKKAPQLILAKKYGTFIHDAPYGIDKTRTNFYFSHLFNCPFDCQYCFLQGLFQSATYVFFINIEDFGKAIEKPGCYFTGYDADSLGLDAVTGFVDALYPIIEEKKDCLFELRTKAGHCGALLKKKPLENVVVAFSLSPESIAARFEKKAPSLTARLHFAAHLAQKGFSIGLRFDPLIFCTDFEGHYGPFFDRVFQTIPRAFIHSITLGVLRFPKDIHRRIEKLLPQEPLLCCGMTETSSQMTYSPEVSERLFAFCLEKIRAYNLENICLFPLFPMSSKVSP